MAKYNSMFDMAFSIEHDYENTDDIPFPDLLDALQKRINYLRIHPEDGPDAFGHCDTYQIPEQT